MKAGEKRTVYRKNDKRYIQYLRESDYTPSSIESFIRRFQHEKELEYRIRNGEEDPYIYSSPDDRYGFISKY